MSYFLRDANFTAIKVIYLLNIKTSVLLSAFLPSEPPQISINNVILVSLPSFVAKVLF